MNVVVEPSAEDDVIAAAVWYEQQVMGLGLEFTRVIDASLSEIGAIRCSFRKCIAGRAVHCSGAFRMRSCSSFVTTLCMLSLVSTSAVTQNDGGVVLNPGVIANKRINPTPQALGRIRGVSWSRAGYPQQR